MREIALIVRFRTSGGKVAPHVLGDGELLEVVEDGLRRRAKTADARVAYRWLETNGFAPTERRWLDPAGYLRRRKQVYRKEGAR
jgi:hypothetical protein